VVTGMLVALASSIASERTVDMVWENEDDRQKLINEARKEHQDDLRDMNEEYKMREGVDTWLTDNASVIEDRFGKGTVEALRRIK